ncbi:MAG: dihydropteroate synthase, partial [Burkholderiales bacterium]|nr:dihydropteroate synthase [Burkholderiales bacterium]
VMGVVNVTPDSFADGGRYFNVQRALQHARALVDDGADIVDIGGESTRPGAQPVGESEELDRVLPIVEALANDGALVSIDTMKPAVMRAAVAAGACMVNDVRALREPRALEAVAATSAAVCLMHMQGEPRTMQVAPVYEDVVTEVREFLSARASACESAGIARDRIVLDPGFGFGKTVEHNLQLLRELPAITALGYPVLAGLSRKSMLGRLTGRDVGERLAASLAAALAAVARGARIVRVHDVRETVDALRVWTSAQGPAGSA